MSGWLVLTLAGCPNPEVEILRAELAALREECVTHEELDAAGYATQAWVGESLVSYVGDDELDEALDPYVTAEELDDQGYVTFGELALLGYVTYAGLGLELQSYATTEALDLEASQRAADDATLAALITAEATTRATEDSALDARITAEASSRAAADATHTADIAALDARVTALESDVAALDTRVTAVESDVATLLADYVSIDDSQAFSSGMAALAMCEGEEANNTTDVRAITDGSTGDAACTAAGFGDCGSVHALYAYDDLASSSEESGDRYGGGLDCDTAVNLGNENILGAWACCTR